MNQEDKHIIYTAADIKRYLAGGMTPAEMHAIEMAALDDPFLAEAMEGYELMEQNDWSQELVLLKQNLKEEKRSPVIPISKAPAYKWWRAAAAITVIGCTVATAYIFTSKKQTAPASIAKATATFYDSVAPVVAAADSATTNTTQYIASGNGAYKVDQLTSAGLTSTAPGKSSPYNFATTENKANTDSAFLYTAPQTYSYDLATKDEVAVTDDSRRKVAVEQSAGTISSASNNAIAAEPGVDKYSFLQKEEADKAKSQNNVNAASNNFMAQVVTPDNKPVSFANVNVPQNKKPIYTDANGRFKVASPDTAVNVTVTSAGYSTQKFRLQNTTASNVIVLKPAEVHTEKIETTAKLKRAAVKKPEVLTDSTGEEEEEDYEPAGGWVEYNNYLNNNLVMPGEAKSKNIHGEVEVFVKLKNNGDISRVSVAKPLCTECDAEALRLVKEGPKFELKNNKTKKVKVKVKF